MKLKPGRLTESYLVKHYLNLDGSNADQNINIGAYSLTTNQLNINDTAIRIYEPTGAHAGSMVIKNFNTDKDFTIAVTGSGGVREILFDSSRNDIYLPSFSELHWGFAPTAGISYSAIIGKFTFGGQDVNIIELLAGEDGASIETNDNGQTVVKHNPGVGGYWKFQEDNFPLYFGAGDDAIIEWSTDGDDNLLIDPQKAAAGHYVVLNVPKTTTGDPANPVEGMIYWNTFDNVIKMYADGAWRTLASW